MTALFALLPIFGFATIFNIFLKKRVSISIFFSITAIISILFLFGMFNILQIGTYMLFYGGILVLVLMSIVYTGKISKTIKSVPFTMFVVASIVYLYFMKNTHFFFWDEYSHWGAFIKYMYYTHTFYDLSCSAAHLNYPPGITLWDYFVVSNTAFTDGNVYFAYFLLIFSSLLMMYEKLNWKQIHWILLIFIIQVVLLADFGHWLSSIYVDHVVGVMFAGLVLSYLSDNFKAKELLLFIFPLISIVLVKEIGLYFGLSFLGLVILLNILDSKLQNAKSIIFNISLNKYLIIISLSLFIVSFLALKSWGIRQEAHGISQNAQTMSNVVKNILSNKKILDKKDENEVKQRFWKVVKYQQLHQEKISLNYNEFSYGIMSKYTKTIKLSTIGTMVFFILMLFMILSTNKDERYKTKIILIYSYLLFVNIIYLFILYFSFLVAFGTGALRIPSFVRYMNMGILPMFIIGFSVLLPMFNKNYNYTLKRKFFISSFIILILIFITRPYLKPMYSQLKNGFRATSDKISKNIIKTIPIKSKLFVVFPIRNNGSLNNILRYSLIPINSTISSYKFSDKSFQEMINIYSKYDYIWFVQFNKALIKKNRVFLRGKPNHQAYTLYKVKKSNNNVKFIPVL
jgi:hypothetical protein